MHLAPLMLMAGTLAAALCGAASGAWAQCYPGLACPPVAAPQNPPQAPAARESAQSHAVHETYRVQDTVSGGILNMRAEPRVNARLIVAIPADSRGVEVARCVPSQDGASRFDWCSAKWQGYKGWVSSCCIVGEQSNRRP
jgi:hypothetical protein